MIDNPSCFPKTTFRNSSRLRIWQQNVNRSLTAQLDLINNLYPDYFDIITLQEPYFDALCNSHGLQQWIAVYPPDHQNPQCPTPCSFILVNTHITLKSWELLVVPSPDITAICLKTGAYTLLIYNVYNTQDHDNTLRILSDDTHMRLSNSPHRRETIVLWLGDFNRHSPVWDAAHNNHLFTTQNLAASDHLLRILARHDLIMALPPGIPTLEACKLKNETRSDNVFISGNGEDCIIHCQTYPALRPPCTDHYPVLTALDLAAPPPIRA